MPTPLSSPRAWLSDSLFNLLVDYYTEVPFRPYGAGNTRRNTLAWLKQLDLGYLCIYVKGHSGYTTWKSSLKTQHPMLGQDMPRFFRRLTREAGCRLVLYYSGLLDGVAGERHPEWRMKSLDGKDKNAFAGWFFTGYGMCPQSQYWDQWVSVHLREIIEGYEPDGIWVDGDWPGPCYCHRCQATFRRESGWKGPWKALTRRGEFATAYQRVWNRIESGWRDRFNAFVKQLKPDCAYSAGNVSPRREFLAPFDWRSGDFFSPGFFHLHDMARMMRHYGTLGVPYDAYVCDTSMTHARRHVRSRSKTVQRMMQEAATVAVNGAAVGYWTYPLGNGALVPSRMRKAVAVRRFIAQREDVLRQTRSASWTAIVLSDPAVAAFGNAGAQGAHKMLAELHRSPDLMDETGVVEDMTHDLMVLPEQAFLDDATAAGIERFVRRGGKLLTNGATIQSPAIRKLLGVASVARAAIEDGHVLLRHEPFGEPTGIDAPWDRLKLDTGKTLYPLYLSWDQHNPRRKTLPNLWPMHGQLDEANPAPAGCPAAIYRRLGRGLAVHIATDIFSKYLALGDPQMRRWMREILEFMQPRPLLRTDAPCWVDVSLRTQGDRLLIHLVNQNPGRDVVRLHTDDLWVDEIPSVGPYAFELRSAAEPSAVTLEPGGQSLPFHFKGGLLRVTLPLLAIHACIVVRGWQRPA